MLQRPSASRFGQASRIMLVLLRLTQRVHPGRTTRRRLEIRNPRPETRKKAEGRNPKQALAVCWLLPGQNDV
jgi:hypothetical protein